jgi:hypothetical protein
MDIGLSRLRAQAGKRKNAGECGRTANPPL